MSVTNESRNLLINLRQARKAILGRGGTLTATAGLDVIPKAIFNIPADASLAFYTDDTAAYKKTIPSGAEEYAEIDSVGGITVSGGVVDGGVVNGVNVLKNVLKKSGVTSIVSEKVTNRIINHLEGATADGWVYDGNDIHFSGTDADAVNCFKLINAPEGVSATIRLYYQDTEAGTFGLGETLPTLISGYYGIVTFTGISVGTVIYPMLFNNTLPSEYTSTYYPYYQSVDIAKAIDTVELPEALVNDEHWGCGILTSEGEYRGNSYDFNTKKYTKYIDATYVVDGVNIVAKAFTSSSGRVSIQLPDDVAEWGSASNKLNVIASGFTTSDSAEDMTVQLPMYNSKTRYVYFYIDSSITSKDAANSWFAAHPTEMQIARKTAVVETLDLDIKTPVFVKTVPNGNVVFENEAKADVQSSIKYVRKV